MVQTYQRKLIFGIFAASCMNCCVRNRCCVLTCNKTTWAYKLESAITKSEEVYEDARQQLMRENKYAYCERLNPPPDTGIGDMSKLHPLQGQHFLLVYVQA